MKRYQFIESFEDLWGDIYPVIADYGMGGPEPGKDAAWAYTLRPETGEVVGFDPTDMLRWSSTSEVIAEFDGLDEAIEYLRQNFYFH